jgi:hypothetical protein
MATRLESPVEVEVTSALAGDADRGIVSAMDASGRLVHSNSRQSWQLEADAMQDKHNCSTSSVRRFLTRMLPATSRGETTCRSEPRP